MVGAYGLPTILHGVRVLLSPYQPKSKAVNDKTAAPEGFVIDDDGLKNK
jgi:hypothetical protein